MITALLLLLYVGQAAGLYGIFALMLIGSRWNHPAVVVALTATWPIALVGFGVRGLYRYLRDA